MVNKSSFLIKQFLILGFSAIGLLLIFELTSIDIWLNDFFYNPEIKEFSLRNHPFLTQVMHHGMKTAMYVLGVASIIFAIWKLKVGKTLLTARHVWAGSLGVIVIPALVALLKHLTNKHCPWSLDVYGGSVPYAGLFEAHLSQFGTGQCFPAGHAAGGFMWFAWAITLWFIYPKFAKIIFYVAITLGLIMGVSRMMQGAHFFSHVLWTAWFSWLISLVLALIFKLIPGNELILKNKRSN
jgi:membrane-associated PAP2 superfamily phosphatase